VRAPRVIDRRVIELSDAALPSSRQPYHAVMRAPRRVRTALERRLSALVHRVTRRSLGRLVREQRHQGLLVRRVALVVGSLIDPATIGNEHIRAHALEGRLFRTALERAARAARLSCSTHLERGLYAAATTRLKRPAAELKRRVTALGHALAGPWRADEKAATLAAWMALSRAH
jgi:hypothetical protein